MKKIYTALLLALPLLMFGQIAPGVYKATEILENGKRNYLLLITESYLVHSVYDSNPAKFGSTLGGFYTVEEDSLKAALEFNSEFEKNGAREFRATFGFQSGQLILNEDASRPYIRQPEVNQPLDGLWLFATRGPDTGQERRGDNVPRKTLKFLTNGHFQWIAYNVKTMDFRGTGGGKYAALDGVYTEVIEFFSRDDSRVGAELSFEFERKGDDWHHKGKNSKGEPMYEIWSVRK
ncbi:hypothetical protein [Robiginitalea aurantiaca]|uniref:Membrane or secreted protein n=1 Tax=Robiginitalea aurantiaca TaxID=3056915 RepID=A0ABT7WB75_9FLAO|nr:hypothetical protein [Robiginitalea aurantiaca]MDM9630163.1 hypothetical protein [Robiginitalea aurantiaca]